MCGKDFKGLGLVRKESKVIRRRRETWVYLVEILILGESASSLGVLLVCLVGGLKFGFKYGYFE